MADVQYKSWRIEQQSYQPDGDQWRPKAVVSISENGSLHTHPVFARLDVMFFFEKDANAYAIKIAKKWIDDRGPG